MNANTVVALGGVNTYDCFNTEQGSYLDKAYSAQINAAPDSTFTARLDEPGVYREVMDEFSHHKAIISWFLVDEPDQADVAWYHISPSTLISEYNEAAEHTVLPIFSDMQRTWDPDAVNLMKSYAPSMDMWMAEPYGTDFRSLERKVQVLKDADTKPIWLAQNAISQDLIVPKAYWAIINGARGIIYFTWDDFKDQGKLDEAEQAFDELSQLEEAIFGNDLGLLISVDQDIGFIGRSTDDAHYIIAVNPDTVSKEATFTSSLLNDTVTVMFESRTIDASSGSFTDTFAGRSRHVYEISGNMVFCHEADNNPIDMQVSISELSAYIAKWKTGQTSIESLMEAISKWKNGC
jgi:hypothetical protein